MDRRKVLAGMAASLAGPAWAQFPGAIKPQSDPYAQVDPYDDPRNGFPSGRSPAVQRPSSPGFLENTNGKGLSQADKEEAAMGKAGMKYRVAKGGGAVPSERLQKAIRDFCAPFFAVSNRSQLPWNVVLVNANTPNASAGLGGQVIVHAGLISYYDHPGELASTIAHEVGHVDLNHNGSRIEYLDLMEQLRKRGGGPLTDPNLVAQLIPEATGADFLKLTDNAYSVEAENEADRHIAVIFERLGIDMRYAVSDMRKFARLTEIMGGASSIWVTDHPLDADRIATVEMLAATSPRPNKEYNFAGWDELHAAFPTKSEFRGIW